MSGGIMDVRDGAGGGSASMFGMSYIVDPSEAERIVENLSKFKIEDVGSPRWMQQHEKLEKLNLQAHQSAMSRSDEYILESVLTFSKLEVLVHDLLIIEAWKEFVYPLLADRLAGRNSMRLYFVLYHEATVINILEIFLYHKHVCESGGEKLLELVDYVARKMARLNGGYDFRGLDSFANDVTKVQDSTESAKEFAASLENRNPIDELQRHFTEIEFRVCISACSVARFLCEHSDNLPLSVVSRICDTHDLLIMIIPLIENPPWTRRLRNGMLKENMNLSMILMPLMIATHICTFHYYEQ
jgi:zinc finger MYND domain-containing protein 10